jgi:hypothetical protein
VCYWTLVDLLSRPETDPEVLAARAAAQDQPLIRQLFALQQAGGYWGEETKPYTAEGAITALTLLRMHAAVPDERTAAGCRSFLHFSQNENGGFSLQKTTRSGIFPCTTGQHLDFLVYFGLAEDPQVRAAFTFLIEDMSTPACLDCGRYQHRDCLWGAIAALNGLAVLPLDLRTARSAAVAQALAERLLDAPYDFQGEHKRWLTFGVPRTWDLLSALNALTAHGYGQDPRFRSLLRRVLDLQDDQGRWLCGSVSRTWPLEKRGQPAKWVTLDALRLLRAIG